MKIGKVPNTLLDELVIKKMIPRSERVILSAGIGEDFGALDFGEECCIISGDPVTGATKHTGRIAVHVACNDIATCGVAPLAIHTTILLPPGTTEAELGALADEIAGEAGALGVSVIGGHTEVTDAVTRVVISITAFGAARRAGYVTAGGARSGDALVMTKSAALEGTAIIAAEREDALIGRFGREAIERAKSFSMDISVVREGVLAGSFGVRAMHDATEGGVYGAAWEMAEASGKGLIIQERDINVLDVTRDICAYYNIDAYRLISSGSMLIATDRPGALIGVLNDAGIFAAQIAEFTGDAEERYIIGADGTKVRFGQPGADELYKVIN